MKNKIITGVVAASPLAAMAAEGDNNGFTSLTTMLGTATTLAGVGIVLGVLLISWCKGRKIVNKTV